MADAARMLKKDWELTQEAFDRLLACLDKDRESAGEKYEVLRLKLIKYFEWQDLLAPEEMADETMNRAARMILEGSVIQNMPGYLYGAARHLASERRRQQKMRQAVLEELVENADSPEGDDQRERIRVECFEACLASLPEPSRALILAYYSAEKGGKIEGHKLLAERLGISLNSLRIRAYRIRQKLEECIVKCEAGDGSG